MFKFMLNLGNHLFSKLILCVGITLILGISTWAYFNIEYQKKRARQSVTEVADTLSNTIKLGAHYSMMQNSRDDITQIIQNIGTQKEIRNIRIYNKGGQIKFSNIPLEVDRKTNIKDEACYICHRSDPPVSMLKISERTRIFNAPDGTRLLGIISPIYNEPGCSYVTCHVHPDDKKILGALDVVVSLEKMDRELQDYEKGIIAFAGFVFIIISTIIFVIVQKFVNRPIQRLIEGTGRIAKGDHSVPIVIEQTDELGQLALAVKRMGEDIRESQAELNKKKDEYQTLFEQVPCIVTVQDRNYRLVQYNREFDETFNPAPGSFCFYAYKGRNEKCEVCPVEKTFSDGQSHYSEETGFQRDGTPAHWIVKTAPIKNENGEIVAAMEMCLDITPRRKLEEKLEQSEKNYHAIFNNIPTPVFVLDGERLEILDCNRSARTVYGFGREELLNTSFLDLFFHTERDRYDAELRARSFISHAKQVDKSGQVLFVDIWISVSEYSGREVLLVATNDITQRLETEQQLIHAGKMATLGEMATGVAHELNQPLTVIKTASTFFMRRFNNRPGSEEDPLFTMSQKISKNVDRATKIINHMRDFARKSEVRFETIQMNDVLEKAFDMFSQQFRLRGIDVSWHLDPDLPPVKADPDRLEQVFANLFVNARDAIEERCEAGPDPDVPKKISIRTGIEKNRLFVEICDTGRGVPAEIAEKIFEPFFTTKEVGKGTGIGLSISYGILKEFGGNIRLVPGEAFGACFVVQLPVEGEDYGE